VTAASDRDGDRRRMKEAAIRVIDIVVYAAAIFGGFFALEFPPDAIQSELAGWDWLAVFWGWLLLVAGSLGFIGRLVRLWVIEVPGTAAAIFGGLIYLVVLGSVAVSHVTARVAVCMIAIATLALVRRYIELQIFTSEPGVRTLSDRLQAALRRRTANAVAHK
jgi:hypothetical protein